MKRNNLLKIGLFVLLLSIMTPQLLAQDLTQIITSPEIELEPAVVDNLLFLEQETYSVEEAVAIRVRANLDHLRITTPSQTFSFLGTPEDPLIFIPKEQGIHIITAYDETGSIQELEFTVSNTNSPQQAIPVLEKSSSHSLFENKNLLVTFTDETGRVLVTKQANFLNTSAAYSVLVQKNERVHAVLEEEEFTLELNNVVPGKIDIAFNKPQKAKLIRQARVPGRPVTSFAIDPTQADFTTGTLTRTAQGDTLYKCASWNFTQETCPEGWKMIRSLVPGEEYSLQITPDDPAFFETGVATINALKPIIEPGEQAELLMAILDTDGSLVTGANIVLEITSPSGTQTVLRTSLDEIQEFDTGQYQTFFTDTLEEGSYELFVLATAPGVETVMLSSFVVQEKYAFDIVRDSPLSIDPWLGPHTTTLRIEAHDENLSSVQVREKIPAEFTVINSGGANIITAGSETTLIWQNLSLGTSISYTAQAPLISPDLYGLGPLEVLYQVNGTQVSFLEARTWWLAIDPTDTLDPTVNANSALQGTALTGTQVSDISGDDSSYVTFGKNEELTVEMSDPTNSTPISSVSSLSCSVRYTSEGYSPDATFRVDDSFGANVLGTTTLPPSTGSESTVTLSSLQTDPDFNIADLFSLNIYFRNNDGAKSQSISIDDVWCTVSYTEADIEDPVVTLQDPSEGDAFAISSIQFNYTPTDNVAFSSCELFVDGVLNQTNSTPIINGSINSITSSFGDGFYDYTVQCTDTSANVGVAAETRNFSADTNPPTPFSLTAPVNDTVSTDLTPTFTWTATTDTTFHNYTLLLDDNDNFGSPNYVRELTLSPSNNSLTFVTNLFSNTLYYWKVIAEDAVGFQTESSQTFTYTTDTLIPSAFSLQTPSSGTISTDRTPLLDWTSSVDTNFDNYTIQFDDVSDFSSVNHEYSVDGATNSEYQILLGSQLAADTIFYWRVIAYDRAGQNRTSSSFTYTTDNTGPAITPQAPSPGYTESLSNNIEFNFTVTDTLSAVASCELIVNDTSEQTDVTITEGVTQTFDQFLTNGYYEWWVNCTDVPGTETTSAHRFLNVNVTIDNSPPTITLNVPSPNSFFNDSNIQFSYTPSDATGIQNCTVFLDDINKFTCGGPIPDTYDTIITSLSPSYRWPLSGDETDVIGVLSSNGGTDPSWVTTIIPESSYSQAGEYDGSTSVSQLPDASDVNTGSTTQKSISLWFIADTIDTTGNGRMLWKEGDTTNWLNIYTLDESGTKYLYASVGEGGAGGNIDYVRTTIVAGQLYHVLLTLDTVAGEMILYVDGEQKDIDTSLAIGASLAAHGGDPSIGGPDGNTIGYAGATVSGYHDGRIADVVYWPETTVLNSTEIANIYSSATVSGGGVACSVDNAVPNYVTISDIAEGSHNWSVQCYDNATAFNLGVSSTNDFTIDLTPPTTFSLSSPLNDTKTNESVNLLEWMQTTEDNFANYTILINNGTDFSNPDYTLSQTSITQTNISTPSLPDANWYWKVIAYDDAGNTRESTETWLLSIHTQAPEYSNVTENPLDPVQYVPAVTYNFTITVDEPELDSVLFYNDFSGVMTSYAPTGQNGTKYYYEILGLNVSDYQYYWEINDTFGNQNQTITYDYSVIKRDTTTTLYLDGVSDNVTINESQLVNITGLLNLPTGATLSLYENTSLLNASIWPTTRIKNYTTPGYYEIKADYLGSTNYNASSQTLYLTVNDIFAPVVSLEDPPHLASDLDGIVAYDYNVTDSNTIDSCTLYVNGVANGTESSPLKDTTLSFFREYDVNQNLTWQVRCTDAAGFQGNSSIYNLSIDIKEYTLNLVPQICSDADGCTPSNMNVSDTTWEDHGPMSKNPRDNYVYANVTQTSIPLGSTITNVSILWDKYQSTPSGTFYLYWLNGTNWDLICSQAFTASSTATPDPLSCNFASYPSIDDFNNYLDLRANFYYSANPSGVTFGTNYVEVTMSYEEDVTDPTVFLNEPADNDERGTGAISFNVTGTDDNLENCTLYGDFNGTWGPNTTISVSDNLTSGVKSSFLPIDLTVGSYSWNALCVDIAGNSDFASQNYTVNITPPDLQISSSGITFSGGLYENQLTTVFANVFNQGFTTATNFIVQFFLGDPAVNGVQIGTNKTVASLAYTENITLNTTFSAPIGPSKIFVVVDGNDSVVELDELNNEANNTLNVNAYNRVYGNTTVNLTLDNADNDTVVSFLTETQNTGNLFFVRGGSSVTFESLVPIGKTSNDLNTSDDFSDADALLNMTGFNDSVNAQWANNTDRPVTTRTFTISQQTVNEIPIVASDVDADFVTGILWDSADDVGSNLEYDVADKEDLVFIANSESGLIGSFGTQDYEAIIPARLREYAGGPVEMVEIYFELT